MSAKKTAAAEVPAAPAVAAAPEYKFKFALEDNVPLPDKRVGPRGDTAYPFAVMAIKQSFFVPSTDRMPEPWKTLTSMSSRTSREFHPKRFTTARETVDGVTGVRVWRVEDSTEALKAPKVLNRKPKGEAARLAAEAAKGDTSQRQHPTPDFDGAAPPPPPPPPSQAAIS